MQNHSLLDTTFALHFGDDSIGMTIEFADNPHSDSDQSMGYRWIIVFLVAALILGIAILILIFFLVLDKKTKKSLFKSKV